MTGNRENLKTKKRWFFRLCLQKATDFNFHPTSNSSFKLTELLILFTNLKEKGYETRNNEDSVFVLKTKLLKNGEAPILMRITINGQYEETRIQRSVPLKLWNAAKGCSKGKDRASNELNSYLSELATRALEKYKELILEQAISTPSLILKRIFGKDTEMRTLLGTIRQEIKDMEKVVNIDYAPVTINRYRNVLKKLENSITAFYGKEDITFHELTPEFIKAFDMHLKTEAGLCRNTIVRYMKCFKRSQIWHWLKDG